MGWFCPACGISVLNTVKVMGGGGSTNDGGCRGSPERYLASEDELFFSWIWLLKVPPEGLKIFRFAGNFVRRN